MKPFWCGKVWESKVFCNLVIESLSSFECMQLWPSEVFLSFFFLAFFFLILGKMGKPEELKLANIPFPSKMRLRKINFLYKIGLYHIECSQYFFKILCPTTYLSKTGNMRGFSRIIILRIRNIPLGKLTSVWAP